MRGSGMASGRGALCGGLLALVSSGVAWGQAAPAAEPAAPAAPAPAAAPPATTAPAAAPEAPAPAVEGDGYELKIKTLEERVNELKERIFRSKQRLAQLQESVVGGATSTAKARIIHKNDMGDVFTLREVHYFMDGAPLRQEVDTSGSGLKLKAEETLFDGTLPPGNHQLTVNVVYQGSGYGVFSYLEGYSFKLRSSHTFTAEEGKEVQIKVVSYEQGNATTELKDKPTIRYDMTIQPIVKKVEGKGGIQPTATGGTAQ